VIGGRVITNHRSLKNLPRAFDASSRVPTSSRGRIHLNRRVYYCSIPLLVSVNGRESAPTTRQARSEVDETAAAAGNPIA
jgi:hypothetical protein